MLWKTSGKGFGKGTHEHGTEAETAAHTTPIPGRENRLLRITHENSVNIKIVILYKTIKTTGKPRYRETPLLWGPCIPWIAF